MVHRESAERHSSMTTFKEEEMRSLLKVWDVGMKVPVNVVVIRRGIGPRDRKSPTP